MNKFTQKMKKAFTENILWKLLSLLFGIALWFYCINNVQFPSRLETIKAPLVFNTEAIEEKGYVLLNASDLEQKNIEYLLKSNDIIFRQIRSGVSSYLKPTINLSALDNLSDDAIGKLNSINVEPTINTSDVELVNFSPKQVDIVIDKIEEQQIPVSDNVSDVTIGEPKSGYTPFYKATLSRDSVTVKAPSTILIEIETIKFEMNIEGEFGQITKNVTPKAYDRKGNLVESEYLTIYPETITATIDIGRSKELVIKDPEITGTPGSGYVFNGIEDFSPDTIKVMGMDENLENQEEIQLDPIDITGAVENETKEYDLRTYVDSELWVENGEQNTISVTAIIERLVTKTITINSDQLNITNLHKSFVKYEDEVIEFDIIGAESIINEIDAEDIDGNAFITSDLEEGEHEISVNLRLPNKVSLADEENKPSMTITISEQIQPEDGENTADGEENPNAGQIQGEESPEQGNQQN